MDEKNLEPKANSFFSEHQIRIEDTSVLSSNFSDNLRSELHDLYLNINSKSMEANTPKKSILPKIILAFGGLLTIALVAAAGIFFMNNSDKSAERENTKLASELTYFEGKVEYRTSSESGWMEVKENMTLNESSSVRVIGEGRAIITLDDGSIVRLDQDSEATLTSMDPKKIVISNDEGRIYTRVAESEREFIVKTDDADYTALGTAYTTYNEKDKKGVKVFQSKVKTKVSSEDKTVSEGEKFFTKNPSADIVNKIVPLGDGDIQTDEFIQWNKTQDKSYDEYKNKLGVLEDKIVETTPKPTDTVTATPKPTTTSTPKPTSTAGITLTSAGATSDAVKVQWSVSGLSVTNGFKVVYSTSDSTPSYCESSAQYAEASARSAILPLKDGKTYYVRVCRYTGSGCDSYSNTKTVKAPTVAVGDITSITLSSTGGTTVSWSIVGTPSDGFKLVWSKSPNPTYPGSFAGYYGSDKRNGDISWGSNDGPGTYYVRVCEYTSSGCDTYSNQITVDIP